MPQQHRLEEDASLSALHKGCMWVSSLILKGPNCTGPQHPQASEKHVRHPLCARPREDRLGLGLALRGLLVP